MKSRKMFLLFLLSLSLLLSACMVCEQSVNLQVAFTPCTSKDVNTKSNVLVCRGDKLNWTVLVLDLSNQPTEGVLVLFRDEGHNRSIVIVESNASGYASFSWWVPRDYELGPTIITATPVVWNGSFVPDTNHVAVPSSLNVTILSRTNLEAVSYPATLTPGAQYFVTLRLTDNLQNPMPSKPVSLYLDDRLVSIGPTNESGMITLPFIVPKSTTPGTHNLTANYSGDDTHTPVTLTLQVEVIGQDDPVIVNVSLNESIVKPYSPVKVEVQTNGTVNLVTINSTSMSKVSDNLWETVLVAPQAQGNYTLQIRAIGNSKECIINTYIYVDATPPRITAYISNPTPRPGEPVEIIVEATDETEVVAVRVNELSLYKQGNVWRGVFTAPLVEGVHIFNVSVWDKAGNVASTVLACNVTLTPEYTEAAPGNQGASLFASSLLFYFLEVTSGSTFDQFLFTGTLASCVTLIVIVFRRPRSFELIDDLASLDDSLGGRP
ncbi:MAG: Ig-like domain-containing protein [Candidatus Jordarchaeales archaeon]